MANLKKIYQGWKNAALKEFGLLSEEVSKLGEQRTKICSECDWCTKGVYIDNPTPLILLFPKDYYCDPNKSETINNKLIQGCGCPVHKKGLSPESKCPRNKWSI